MHRRSHSQRLRLVSDLSYKLIPYSALEYEFGSISEQLFSIMELRMETMYGMQAADLAAVLAELRSAAARDTWQAADLARVSMDAGGTNDLIVTLQPHQLV